MLVKLLGILDLFIAIMIFAHTNVSKKALLIIGFYLIIKGLLFGIMEDIASYVDIGVGVYVLLMAAGFSLGIFTVIAGLYLIQKGLLSIV
jgi:hypothetical protein